MKTKILTVLVAFALFGCKSEPQVLDEAAVQAKTNNYIAANAANLLEPERLTPTVASSYGILEHEHERFLEIYRRFLTYRNHLPEELQHATAVLQLTLELSLDDPGDVLLSELTPKLANPEDTAYMAYLLLLGPGVDTALVTDVGYIQHLAALFGVTPQLLKRGLWIALQQDLDTLANEIVGSMESELKKGATLSAENFTDKVLVPFLTFVQRGFTLAPENESAIAEAFGRAYTDAKEFSAAFDELRYHINGQESSTKLLNRLNAKLLDKNAFIYVAPGQVNLQEPLNYAIKIDRKELNDVRACKGRGLAQRSYALGCSAYSERDIIVPVDELKSHRDLYRVLIQHGTMPYTVTPEVERLWSQLEIDLDASKVKALYQDLASKAFGDADDATLLSDLFFNTALLQTRCVVDVGANAGLDSVDRAIAAYGAQLSLGRRPELILLDFIQFVQETRLKSTQIDDNKRIDALLKSLLQMAGERQNATLDSDGLKAAIRTLHDNHVSLKGKKKLPDIGAFERSVVQNALVPAASFSMP